MAFFKFFLLYPVLFLMFSCEPQFKLQAVNEPVKVISRDQGPHAISFAKFVVPRPFNSGQHFAEMNEKGAVFYKDGGQISFEEVKIFLNKSPLKHIETTGSTSDKPKVSITLNTTANASVETIQSARTDPAAALMPFLEKDVVFFIGEKFATLEEVTKVYRTSEFPVRMFTAQIDDQPLRVIIMDGC